MTRSRAATWRWVRRGVVALCVGVVVTYGVAWGVAYFSGPAPQKFATMDQWVMAMDEAATDEATGIAFSTFGQARFDLDNCTWMGGPRWMLGEFAKLVAAGKDEPPIRPTIAKCAGRVTLCDLKVPWWACAEMASKTGLVSDVSACTVHVFASGAPFISHVGSIWWNDGRGSEFRSIKGIQKNAGRPDKVWIPLRPVMAGLVANTVFYAACFSMLVWGPGLVRKWNRVRRGRCGACGYDVKGIAGGVCPECGGSTLSGSR